MKREDFVSFIVVFVFFSLLVSGFLWYLCTDEAPRAVWPHGDHRISPIQSGEITSAWIDTENESWRLFVAFRDGGFRRCSLGGVTMLKNDNGSGKANIVRVENDSASFVYLTLSVPTSQYKTLYEAGWKNSPRRVKVTF
jgi:hypothetical protein